MLALLLTGCAAELRSAPPADVANRTALTPTLAQISATSDTAEPSPMLSATSQLVDPSPPTTTPIPSSFPSLIATGSPDDLLQPYTNSREDYTVSLPPDWTVITSLGAAYFLNQAGLDQRSQGRTDWESSIGGIQFVGRHARPTEDERYGSILPNHCSIIDWQPFETNGRQGRIYTLDCDHPVTGGIYRRQHMYIPYGSRFVEVWMNVDRDVSGAPTRLLAAIVATLKLPRASS